MDLSVWFWAPCPKQNAPLPATLPPAAFLSFAVLRPLWEGWLGPFTP